MTSEVRCPDCGTPLDVPMSLEMDPLQVVGGGPRMVLVVGPADHDCPDPPDPKGGVPVKKAS